MRKCLLTALNLAAATLDRRMETLLLLFCFFLIVGTRRPWRTTVVSFSLTVNNEVLFPSDRADALCVILKCMSDTFFLLMTAAMWSLCGDKCDRVPDYLHRMYFGALSWYVCMNSWEENQNVVMETCKKKKNETCN